MSDWLFSPVWGWNCKWRAITISTQSLARLIWVSLLGSPIVTVARLSMYPSTPAFVFGGSFTSVSKAAPIGMLLHRYFVSEATLARGDLILSGSQWGQQTRTFARSHVMSDPIEKCAGAGVEPKGSWVRRTVMSLLSSVGQIAMHFDAIFGVV